MTIPADFIQRVREALGVSSSYDAASIPAGIRRALTRLLRDYNFPSMLMRVDYDALTADQIAFPLPDGFKQEVAVTFYDPPTGAVSPRLWKSEGPIMALRKYMPDKYWLGSGQLNIDTGVGPAAGCSLRLFYLSCSVTDNEDWLLQQFEDVVFSLSVYRLAPEVRKPDVAQAFGPLWQEDQRSIAVYANELEFDNLDMVQREARPALYPWRYPAVSDGGGAVIPPPDPDPTPDPGMIFLADPDGVLLADPDGVLLEEAV